MAGCGHTHEAQSEWKANAQNHWHECKSCDELLDNGSHTLNDENCCEICGKGVDVYIDGAYSIYSYDEYGVLIEDSYYAEDGSLLSRYRYVYEYYEDGNVKSKKNYVYDIALYDGKEFLESESITSYCTNSEYGEVYESKLIYYYEDGSKTVYEYTENSYISKVTNMTQTGKLWK